MVFLENDLSSYYRGISNLHQKIRGEIKKNRIIRVRRGIYSTNPNADYLYIANKINNNSYISFDYALYYYGLIPECVRVITSATMNVNKKKTFITNTHKYTYRDINSRVFFEGINCIVDSNHNNVRIASKEKAICDKLSTIPQIRTLKDINNILFNDLRIDKDSLYNLNISELVRIARLYHKPTLNTFAKFLEKEVSHE